jgi:hypothetical protein
VSPGPAGPVSRGPSAPSSSFTRCQNGSSAPGRGAASGRPASLLPARPGGGPLAGRAPGAPRADGRPPCVPRPAPRPLDPRPVGAGPLVPRPAFSRAGLSRPGREAGGDPCSPAGPPAADLGCAGRCSAAGRCPAERCSAGRDSAGRLSVVRASESRASEPRASAPRASGTRGSGPTRGSAARPGGVPTLASWAAGRASWGRISCGPSRAMAPSCPAGRSVPKISLRCTSTPTARSSIARAHAAMDTYTSSKLPVTTPQMSTAIAAPTRRALNRITCALHGPYG